MFAHHVRKVLRVKLCQLEVFGDCFAMFNTVFQEMTIPTFIFLCLLNMWLTRFSKP